MHKYASGGRPVSRSRLVAASVEAMGVEWDNGLTGSEATWYTVLGEGVQHGDEPTRQAMAEAVLEDGAGFEAILDRIPAEDRPALERLRALALHPDAGRSLAEDPATERDRQVLYDRKAEANCAWM